MPAACKPCWPWPMPDREGPVEAPFLPYGKQEIGDADIKAVVEALVSGWLTTGPRVSEFEKAFAAYCGASEGVAVNSGTAALHCAMRAIGVERGGASGATEKASARQHGGRLGTENEATTTQENAEWPEQSQKHAARHHRRRERGNDDRLVDVEMKELSNHTQTHTLPAR